MIDTSKFTLNTLVLFKCMQSGIYLPEVNSYTPVRTYASINDIISILNRGISVEFPNQSKEMEISKKIEEILLDYQERKNALEKKHGNIGTDINNALDTIQEINDSKEVISPVAQKYSDSIFEYGDIAETTKRNLTDEIGLQIFDSDDYMSAEERISNSERDRKVSESLRKRKHLAYMELQQYTESMQRLAQDAKYHVDALLGKPQENETNDTIINDNEIVYR